MARWKRPDKQDRSGLKGPPGPAQASTPKPEFFHLTILCFLPNFSDTNGGCLRPHFSEGNQLRTLVGKSLGHDKSVSIQTPLIAF